MKKIIFLATLLFASHAFAYDLTNQFGIGINGGYPIPVFGNTFNDVADAKWQAGVHARYHLYPSLFVEAAATRSKFKDTDLKFTNYDLLGVWRTCGTSNFTPIVGVGLGMTKISNYIPSSMKLSTLLRLGIEHGFNPHLSLGVFADYQYVSKILGDMPTGPAHVITPQMALTWYFGSNDHKQEMKQEKIQEEPKKEEVVAAAPAVIDSDGDGVPDSEDKCPNTKPGEKVNAYGCAVHEKAEIKINVEFATGKADIDSQYDAHLNEVAEFFKKYPKVKAQISGYTDNSGSPALNTKLSQKRAEAVKNYLVKLGVEKNRLTAKGYGPKFPVTDNATAEGRARNRRVVAIITSVE